MCAVVPGASILVKVNRDLFLIKEGARAFGWLIGVYIKSIQTSYGMQTDRESREHLLSSSRLLYMFWDKPMG